MIQQLLTSDLAYRLGWTVTHSLWQGAVVAMILWLALPALRRRSPQARYLLCTGALALILLGMVVTFVDIGAPSHAPPAASANDAMQRGLIKPERGKVDFSALAPLPQAVMPADSNQLVAKTRGDESINAPRSVRIDTLAVRLEPAMPWIVTIWIVGVLLMSCWNLGSWLAAQRLRVLGTRPPKTQITQIAERLAQRMQLTRPVRVLESLVAQTPVVIGWLRPVVLLPASVLTGLTAAQLEAILAHEFAHVLRHDYLVNLFQVAAETLLFYHPAVWWMSRCIRLEREQCCDDLAVCICGNRCDYVESLATLEEIRGNFALAAGGSARQLSIRARRLLANDDDPPRRGARALIACAALAAGTAFALLHAGSGTTVHAAPPTTAPTTAPAPAANAEQNAEIVGPLRYRPIVEQSFPAAGPEEPVFISLETGKQLAAPKHLVGDDLLKWARDAGVDLQVRRGSAGTLEIASFDLFDAFGKKQDLDVRASPRGTVEWFGWPRMADTKNAVGLGQFYPMGDLGNDFSVTFRTRVGCMGELTVDSLPDGRLSLRYMTIEAGLADGKGFTARLDSVSLRVAALEELKRRAAPNDLILLLKLNGQPDPGIQLLGDGRKDPNAILTGIGDVTQIKSFGHVYTAVAARVYPQALGGNPIIAAWGLGEAFFFDDLGNLAGHVGGELGSDNTNGDDVYFQKIDGEDPWCVSVERFETYGDFQYRKDIYLIEPRFPRALRLWVQPPGFGSFLENLATAGQTSRYGFIFEAAHTPNWATIQWDPSAHLFRGPSSYVADGKTLMEVDTAESANFAVAQPMR
jgi:beta-lactamase regulating signal transducer with metallopeptidase domain